MARGSDVKSRMVQAGAALLARRGYGITMLDVVKEADSPRGSIYYHFPGGKEELSIAAAARTGSELRHLVEVMGNRHERVDDFLDALVSHHAERLVRSGFSEGCPLLGLTVSMDVDSEALRGAAADAFDVWVNSVGEALRGKGVEAALSAQLASAIVGAIEGAIVLARARRRREPLDGLRALIPAIVAGAVGTPQPS